VTQPYQTYNALSAYIRMKTNDGCNRQKHIHVVISIIY